MGISVPFAIPCLDEMEVEAEDSPELLDFLHQLQGFLDNVIAQMTSAMSAAEQAQGEAAASEAQAAEAQAAAAAATEAADALKLERDALLAEVQPLRTAAIAAAKAQASKLVPGVGLDACEDLAAVRRAVVAAKIPALAKASDAQIEGAWSVLVAGMDAAEPTPVGAPSPGFMAPTAPVPPTTAPASRSRALLS